MIEVRERSLERGQGPPSAASDSGISRAVPTSAGNLQRYCGEIKNEELLSTGLDLLKDIQNNEAPQVSAQNPHDLVRTLEVWNILFNAEIILNACLARKASSNPLHFRRSDYPETDPPEWNRFITIRLEENDVVMSKKPLDYYGFLKNNYESHNQDYLEERRS